MRNPTLGPMKKRFQKISPPEPDRQGQRGRGDKPGQPKPISAPFAAKPKPHARNTSRTSREGKGGGTTHLVEKGKGEEGKIKRGGKNPDPQRRK